MCELAYISRDLSTGMPVLNLLTSQLGNFHQLFQKSLQDEDEALARAITRIVSEMGESYIGVIAEASPDAVQMVQLIVTCASHPDNKVASLTYVFWWRLNGMLKDCPSEEVRCPCSDCACLCSLCNIPLCQIRSQRLGAFEQCFYQMLLVLARSAMFPEEVDEWGATEEEEFKNFRLEHLYDCMLDIAEMVGGDQCLGALLPVLNSHMESSQSPTTQDKWREVEGCLFCVRAFARYVHTSEQKSVPFLLGLYQRMTGHERLRQAFTIVVAKFGRWINEHPNMLGPLLDYVVQGLGLPKVGQFSAEVLKPSRHSC